VDLIHVDVETRSRVSLKKLGAWGYAQDSSTDVWCVCWRMEGDTGEVKVWVPGDPVPAEFNGDQPYGMAAHNYRFEQAVWTNILVKRFGFAEPTKYACTMAMAMANNLPASLANLAARLGVEEQKDVTASRIMVKMANKKTYEPTKEGSTAHKNHGENLQILVEYCKQDVRTEEAAYTALKGMQFNWSEFWLDQRINDRGVFVDIPTAKAIDKAVAAEVKLANIAIKELSAGEVGTGKQVAKMLAWLSERGYPFQDLAAPSIKEALENTGRFTMTPEAIGMLKLRKQLALGSVAKYAVMQRCTDDEGRMHGLFQYMGASQTGRWAGRSVQFQNLPRMSLNDIEVDLLCRLFRSQDLDTIRMFGFDVIGVAKQLIRPMFTAKDSEHTLVVSDYSQIECRVLGFLAQCPVLLDRFSDTKRDPYSEMAADIYKRPVAECGKGTDARQLGKCAVLGCGYGMGKVKFVESVKNQTGLEISMAVATQAVDTYRGTFYRVVQFWKALEKAVKFVLRDEGGASQVGHLIAQRTPGDSTVSIRLPSGRCLFYPEMHFGSEGDLRFSTSQGVEGYTYGGKLVENVTQAVARDVLIEAMARFDSAGMPIVGHVHDEILLEIKRGSVAVEEIDRLMLDPPTWAKTLPLAVETSFCDRYTK